MVLSPNVAKSPNPTTSTVNQKIQDVAKQPSCTDLVRRPQAEVVDLTVSPTGSPLPEAPQRKIQEDLPKPTPRKVLSGWTPTLNLRKDTIKSTPSISVDGKTSASSPGVKSVNYDSSANGIKDVSKVYGSPKVTLFKTPSDTASLSAEHRKHADLLLRSKQSDNSVKPPSGKSTAISSPVSSKKLFTNSKRATVKKNSRTASSESEWSNSEEERTSVKPDSSLKMTPRQPLVELKDRSQTKSSGDNPKPRSIANGTPFRTPSINGSSIPRTTPTSTESASRTSLHLTVRRTDRDSSTRSPVVASSLHSRRRTSLLDGSQKSRQIPAVKVDSVKTVPIPVQKTFPQPRVMTISLEEYETNLKSHIAQMQEDQSYYVRNKLKQARISTKAVTTVLKNARSPFEGIGSIACDSNSKSQVGKFGHFVRGSGERNNGLIPYSITSYKQEQKPIPPYTAYISAKRNVLTEDDRQRTFLPYHGDDFEVDDADKEYAALETKIEENQVRYHRLNKLHDQARMYQPYAEAFLADIGCSSESVLRYLLNEKTSEAPDALPKEYRPYWDLRASYLRDGYYEEEDDQAALEREDTPYQAKPRPQWQQLYGQLTNVSDRQLAIACVACRVFQNLAGFSLFHIVQNLSHDSIVLQTRYSLGTYTELACFICKVHECPGHGEYHDDDDSKNVRDRVNFKPESPDPESKSTYRTNEGGVTEFLGLHDDGEISGPAWTTLRHSDSSGFEDTDLCGDDCFWAKQARVSELSTWSSSDNEAFAMLRPAYEHERRGPCLMAQCGVIPKPCKEIFYKLLVEPSQHTAHSLKIRNEMDETKYVLPPRKTIDQWCDDSNSGKAWRQDAREPFLPCDHLGPCTKDTNCSCFSEGVQCEKSCACSDACTRRFFGCRCHAKGKPCRTEKCECRRLNRECDPDICMSCGAEEVLDPVNRHDEEAIAGKCCNVAIQRGVPKRTLLGPSKLMADGGKSGWGLYMGQECKKDDFIGEYRGEIISEAEADQRGTIYDKRNMSYLFRLNAVQNLDSTLIGNKLRFINHQADPMSNCYAKLRLCHGVVRIGMFAQKDIGVGEEMFFNYGEGFAAKFDLIKMNSDGSVTVERPQKQSRPKETFRRRVSDTRPSQYQLKNKVSKNGLRVGRPPKGKEKNRQPSSAATEALLRKRRRSETPDRASLVATSSRTDQSVDTNGRSQRKRAKYTSVELDSDDTDDTGSRRRTRSSRLESIRQRSTVSGSPASTPKRTREASNLTDTSVRDRTRTKASSVQTESPLRLPNRNRSSKEDERSSEVAPDNSGEEEEEDTPRRSNRRRLEKQHFDEAAMTTTTNSMTASQTPISPVRARRTARKEVS